MVLAKATGAADPAGSTFYSLAAERPLAADHELARVGAV
jgi:hypothetical protein